jgi:hypothetical protein
MHDLSANDTNLNLMSNPVLNPRLKVSGWEPKFPFDLVVAYEDVQTRNRALHLHDHLAQQLLDDYDFQCLWWKFDHLANPTLRQQAIDAAAEANMIVLSLRARKELPRAYQAWLDGWLARRDNRKSALVVLVAGSEEAKRQAGPMLLQLRTDARLAGMDFFNHAFDLPLPPPRAEPAVPSVVPARPAHSTSPELEFLYHQMPTPRWGINE